MLQRSCVLMPDRALSAESMERYRRSAGKAQVADLLGKITGASTDLISYDAVANRLRARQQIEMGTRMVPLDQIVGSVGRYRDFTRTFLPRAGINPERWARVDAIMHSLEGYLPIELYKIGEVYFVRDGNHRVSVARGKRADPYRSVRNGNRNRRRSDAGRLRTRPVDHQDRALRLSQAHAPGRTAPGQ